MNPEVTTYINSLPAWQQKNLHMFRAIVQKEDDVQEAIKWGVPVFLLKGKTVLSMAGFKAHTKFNFFFLKRAAVENVGIFNSKNNSFGVLENVYESRLLV